jgi:hypothetical protein
VLRHALLYVYAEAAAAKQQFPVQFMLQEFYLAFAGAIGPFVWSVLEGNTVFPVGSESTIPMEEYLKQHDPVVAAYHAALDHVATLPEAEVDRLFSETLDLASHGWMPGSPPSTPAAWPASGPTSTAHPIPTTPMASRCRRATTWAPSAG